MNQAERAGRELRAMDDLAAQDSFLHRLSPLSKLFVTIFYLAVVVSFPRYRLTALVWMALFPVAGYQLAGIALRTCFQKLRLVLPLVCAVGLLNPIFDRQIVTQIGTLAVSGGVVSMLTLVMKGVFCLLASFLLMATTTIEEICRALRQLHLPKTITSLLLLTFRYIGVLLSEVSVMQEAYSLRAPGQKGVHISPGARSSVSCCCAAWTGRRRCMRAWSCAASAGISPTPSAAEARPRPGRMRSCARR